jgi:oxygen-independent coproporphyrinogen-3 oxidase
MEFKDLLHKYSQPAPRYTSYPTVPEWDTTGFSPETWTKALQRFWSGNQAHIPAQIYIHLPYCESLCTFCACNKRITQNHKVEEPYIRALLEEWKMYTDLHGGPIPISEIHLGGGTPTFFSDASLEKLILGIRSGANLIPDADLAIEVHPGTTRPETIRHLAKLGFSRLSIGIQDFSPFILEKIHRFQTFEETRKLVLEARKSGFRSVNFDLVYGLPFQTPSHISDTIQKVLQLQPDRIAFYGYAHVPWKSKGQRRYTDADVPETEARWELFETGRNLLLKAGYEPIGFDHFALPDDALSKAAKAGTLHRNFMGYTERGTPLLLGLGASAIGETPDAYAQNATEVEAWFEGINEKGFPISKGHLLNQEDQDWKAVILNLMCKLETDWNPDTLPDQDTMDRLYIQEAEGLISVSRKGMRILEKGLPFLRSICLQLDQRHWARKEAPVRFSVAV